MTNELEDLQQFFTRDKANEGIIIPLFHPGTSQKTEHWIKVRGIDSDAYQEAFAKSRRDIQRAITSKNPSEELEKIDKQDATLSLLAALVIEWSSKSPCTTENVKALFKQAPQIADAVSELAGRRSLFFGKKQEDSLPLPGLNLS